MRGLVWGGVFLTAGWLASAAVAANDDSANIPAAGESTSATTAKPAAAKKEGKKESKAPLRDPVAAAFAFPRGVTSLDARQEKAYERLKSQYESSLRDAIAQSKEATDPKEKNKAAGQVRQIRVKIKAAMKDVIALGYQDAQQQAMQQMQQYNNRPGGHCPCGR